MKKQTLYEIGALIVGLSAVIVFTFYLATKYNKALIFTEQEIKKSKGEKINEEERRRNRSS